jgi:hypothetical protein
LPEDLRLYRVHQRKQGVQPPTMNGAVLRFFFTKTCNRPEMARHPRLTLSEKGFCDQGREMCGFDSASLCNSSFNALCGGAERMALPASWGAP